MATPRLPMNPGSASLTTRDRTADSPPPRSLEKPKRELRDAAILITSLAELYNIVGDFDFNKRRDLVWEKIEKILEEL